MEFQLVFDDGNAPNKAKIDRDISAYEVVLMLGQGQEAMTRALEVIRDQFAAHQKQQHDTTRIWLQTFYGISDGITRLIAFWTDTYQDSQLTRQHELILDILTRFVRVAPSLEHQHSARSLGLKILNEHIKCVHRQMSSTNRLAAPCFKLLTALVCFSRPMALEVHQKFNLGMKVLPRYVSFKALGIREAYMRFLLALFEHGDSTLKKMLLESRGLLASFFKNLVEDGASLVAFFLQSIYEHIVLDEHISRKSKLHLLSNVNLEHLLRLYSNGEEYAKPTHDFLLKMTCTPGVGVCFSSHGWFSPLKDTQQLAGDDESIRAQYHNPLLINLTKALRLQDDALQQDLLVEMLRVTPELVRPFWQSSTMRFDPRPEVGWLNCMNLLAKIVSLDPPAFRAANADDNRDLTFVETSHLLNPPSSQVIVENILPRVLSRVALSKGLQHSNLFVKYVTGGTMAACFDKYERVMSWFDDILRLLPTHDTLMDDHVGDQSIGAQSARKWYALRQAVMEEFHARLPDFQILVALNTNIGSISVEDDELMQVSEQEQDPFQTFRDVSLLQVMTLRLIRNYYKYCQDDVIQSRFDFSKLLSTFQKHLEKHDMTESDILLLENVFDILDLAVNEFKWFNKANTDLSYLGLLLQFANRADGKLYDILQKRLLPNLLSSIGSLAYHQDEIEIWLRLVIAKGSGNKLLPLIRFFDQCILDSHRRLKHYVQKYSSIDVLSGQKTAIELEYLKQLDQKIVATSPSEPFLPYNICVKPSDAFQLTRSPTAFSFLILVVLDAYERLLKKQDSDLRLVSKSLSMTFARILMLTQIYPKHLLGVLQHWWLRLMDDGGDFKTVLFDSVQSIRDSLATRTPLANPLHYFAIIFNYYSGSRLPSNDEKFRLPDTLEWDASVDQIMLSAIRRDWNQGLLVQLSAKLADSGDSLVIAPVLMLISEASASSWSAELIHALADTVKRSETKFELRMASIAYHPWTQIYLGEDCVDQLFEAVLSGITSGRQMPLLDPFLRNLAMAPSRFSRLLVLLNQRISEKHADLIADKLDATQIDVNTGSLLAAIANTLSSDVFEKQLSSVLNSEDEHAPTLLASMCASRTLGAAEIALLSTENAQRSIAKLVGIDLVKFARSLWSAECILPATLFQIARGVLDAEPQTAEQLTELVSLLSAFAKPKVTGKDVQILIDGLKRCLFACFKIDVTDDTAQELSKLLIENETILSCHTQTLVTGLKNKSMTRPRWNVLMSIMKVTATNAEISLALVEAAVQGVLSKMPSDEDLEVIAVMLKRCLSAGIKLSSLRAVDLERFVLDTIQEDALSLRSWTLVYLNLMASSVVSGCMDHERVLRKCLKVQLPVDQSVLDDLKPHFSQDPAPETAPEMLHLAPSESVKSAYLHVVLSLLALDQTLVDLLDEGFISNLVSSYSKSTKTSDTYILRILALAEQRTKQSYLVDLIPDENLETLLENLDAKWMMASVLNYDFGLILEPNAEQLRDIVFQPIRPLGTAYYSPAFWMLWLAHWVRTKIPDGDELMIEILPEETDYSVLNKLFELNLVGLAVASLSSECCVARRLGYFVLDRLMCIFDEADILGQIREVEEKRRIKGNSRQPLNDEGYESNDDGFSRKRSRREPAQVVPMTVAKAMLRNVAERRQLFLLLNSLRNAISASRDRVSDPCPRIPAFISLFVAQVIQILMTPSSDMYPLVNQFLLQRPSMDLADIPMFYALFHSRDVDNSKRERAWILRLMLYSVRTNDDVKLMRKRFAPELLRSMSVYLDKRTQVLISEVLSQLPAETTE